jgi:hypothetical protein
MLCEHARNNEAGHLIQQCDCDLKHLQQAQVTEGRGHFAMLRHGALLCTLIHLIDEFVQDFQADDTVNNGMLRRCQHDNGPWTQKRWRHTPQTWTHSPAKTWLSLERAVSSCHLRQTSPAW